MESNWQEALRADVCTDKRTLSTKTRFINLPLNGDISADIRVALKQSSPQFWYFAASDCDYTLGPNRTRVKFEMEVTNNESQFSMED